MPAEPLWIGTGDSLAPLEPLSATERAQWLADRYCPPHLASCILAFFSEQDSKRAGKRHTEAIG